LAKKLFIPGPVDVLDDVAAEMTKPMIGHRSKDYSELHHSCVERLKKVLYTNNTIFIGPMSSSGWMEAAVLNLVGRKALHVVNGAFSGRWYKISVANGRKADKVDIKWGSACKPNDVESMLNSGEYDTLFVTHNETSTCVATPLEGFGKICADNSVMFCVDAVSSACGAKIETDKLGIDVLVTGTQKCFGVPPGLAMATVSAKALERSKNTPNRGLYFDYQDYLKKAEKDQTPSTPPISLIRALNYQCGKILEKEGLENRFARHAKMAKYTQEWAAKKWQLYAEPWCMSQTVTAVNNSRNFDLAELGKQLGSKGYQFSNGYGDLKGKVFRVAHMADRTMDELKAYLEAIDEITK